MSSRAPDAETVLHRVRDYHSRIATVIGVLHPDVTIPSSISVTHLAKGATRLTFCTAQDQQVPLAAFLRIHRIQVASRSQWKPAPCINCQTLLRADCEQVDMCGHCHSIQVVLPVRVFRTRLGIPPRTISLQDSQDTVSIHAVPCGLNYNQPAAAWILHWRDNHASGEAVTRLLQSICANLVEVEMTQPSAETLRTVKDLCGHCGAKHRTHQCQMAQKPYMNKMVTGGVRERANAGTRAANSNSSLAQPRRGTSERQCMSEHQRMQTQATGDGLQGTVIRSTTTRGRVVRRLQPGRRAVNSAGQQTARDQYDSARSHPPPTADASDDTTTRRVTARGRVVERPRLGSPTRAANSDYTHTRTYSAVAAGAPQGFVTRNTIRNAGMVERVRPRTRMLDSAATGHRAAQDRSGSTGRRPQAVFTAQPNQPEAFPTDASTSQRIRLTTVPRQAVQHANLSCIEQNGSGEVLTVSADTTLTQPSSSAQNSHQWTEICDGRNGERTRRTAHHSRVDSTDSVDSSYSILQACDLQFDDDFLDAAEELPVEAATTASVETTTDESESESEDTVEEDPIADESDDIVCPDSTEESPSHNTIALTAFRGSPAQEEVSDCESTSTGTCTERGSELHAQDTRSQLIEAPIVAPAHSVCTPAPRNSPESLHASAFEGAVAQSRMDQRVEQTASNKLRSFLRSCGFVHTRVNGSGTNRCLLLAIHEQCPEFEADESKARAVLASTAASLMQTAWYEALKQSWPSIFDDEQSEDITTPGSPLGPLAILAATKLLGREIQVYQLTKDPAVARSDSYRNPPTRMMLHSASVQAVLEAIPTHRESFLQWIGVEQGRRPVLLLYHNQRASIDMGLSQLERDCDNRNHYSALSRISATLHTREQTNPDTRTIAQRRSTRACSSGTIDYTRTRIDTTMERSRTESGPGAGTSGTNTSSSSM